MKRLVTFLRRLLRREAAWTPVRRSGLMYDPEFIRGLARPGERFDPLSPTVED